MHWRMLVKGVIRGASENLLLVLLVRAMPGSTAARNQHLHADSSGRGLAAGIAKLHREYPAWEEPCWMEGRVDGRRIQYSMLEQLQISKI
jgi:hypothetical protein